MWRRSNRGPGRGRKQGQWPGNGPFSHLPPWQRPGWLYGPGSCWYLNPQQQNQQTDSEQPITFSNQFATSINFCTECSAPLPVNANYCPSCGKKIGK
jgi:hypothetical protein